MVVFNSFRILVCKLFLEPNVNIVKKSTLDFRSDTFFVLFIQLYNVLIFNFLCRRMMYNCFFDKYK